MEQAMEHQPRTLASVGEMRLFWGLVVQPVLAGGVAFVSFPLLLLDRSGRTLAGGFAADPTDAAVSVALGTGIVALFVTLIGVLPTVLWVVKRHRLTFTETLLFGLGFGNLPVVLGTALIGSYGALGTVRAVAFASLVGLTGAAVFWVISVRGRNFRRHPAAG